MMMESTKKRRAKIAKKHANILMSATREQGGGREVDALDCDVDNYEDSRIELQAAGHNLTSVLMNPRVSLIDNYMDDFEAAQTLPLDSPAFLTAITALHGSSALDGQSSTTSCTTSLLSTAEYYLAASRDDMNNTARGGLQLGGSNRSTTSDLNASTSSIQSVVSYASITLSNSLRDYAQPAPNAGSYFTNPVSRAIFSENQRAKTRAFLSASSSSGDRHGGDSEHYQPSSPMRRSTSDVSYCFKHVPEIYFRPDFSLKHTDIFVEPCVSTEKTRGGSDGDGRGGEGEEEEEEEEGGGHSSTLYTVDLSDDDDSDGGKSNRQSQHGGSDGLGLDETSGTDRASSRHGGEGRRRGEEGPQQHKKKVSLSSGMFNTQAARTLTSYLDLVEVALLRQILARSPSFFRALDDINSLHSCVARAAVRVMHIRRQLSETREGVVRGDIRVPKLALRLQNEVMLNEKIQYMQRVVVGRNMVRALLHSDDYSGALEVVRSTRRVYEQECAGLVAMLNIGKELSAYDEHIAEVMASRFVTLAIEWVDVSDLDSGGVTENKQSLEDDELLKPSSSSSVGADGKSVTDSGSVIAFKESFSQLLVSLLHVQKTPFALEAYGSRLADSIRLIVRTCLLEYINVDVMATNSGVPDSQSSEGSAGGDNSFSAKVRNMSNPNFLSCLQMCLESLLQALRKSVAVHVFICQVYGELVVSDSSDTALRRTEVNESEKESDHQEENETDFLQNTSTSHQSNPSLPRSSYANDNDSSSIAAAQIFAMEKSGEILISISELAQKSICQLLLMRKDSTAKLPLDQMKFMWETVLNFVHTVDKFNHTLLSSSSLEPPPSQNQHTNELADDQRGNGNNASLSSKLSDVGVGVVNLSTFPLRNGLLNQTKKFIEHLHETFKGKLVNTLDNEKWLQCDVSPERQAALEVLTSGRMLLSQKDKGSVSSSPSGSSSSAALLTSTVAPSSKKKELVPITVDGNTYKIFSPITKDVIAKTVEIISLFDSRSKQLVLGAQAIQSAARLKSIAAKHLGITAQSLTFLNSILPHLRAAFLSQLPPEHHLVLVEMDRVSKSVLDHHSKVLQKFVSIVGDFVDASAQKLVVLDWDRFNGQSEYFDEVCRNVSALHRVLSEYLPPDQMQDVFGRIFSLLSRRIPAHFSEVMPSTQTGKQRIMDETIHLVHNLSRLKHISIENLTIEETLRKKYQLSGQSANS